MAFYFVFLKMTQEARHGRHMPLFSAPSTQEAQEDHCEFQVSLVYILSGSQRYIVRHVKKRGGEGGNKGRGGKKRGEKSWNTWADLG